MGQDELFLGLFHALHETDVQLQYIKSNIRQGRQGRVAGPEIVEFHNEALVPQGADNGGDDGRILRVGRLRQFQVKELMGNPVAVTDVPDISVQLGHGKVHAGDVDGNRHYGLAGSNPLRKMLRDFLPHVAVHLRDETVPLKEGNEGPGTHKADLRAVPADQGLRPARPGRPDIVFRLVVDDELLLLQGVFHDIQDLLLFQLLFPQGIVEVGDIIAITPVDRLQSCRRLVAHGVDALVPVVNPVDPVAKGDGDGEISRDSLVQPFHRGFRHQFRLAVTQSREMVPHEAAHDFSLLQVRLQRLRDLTEDTVAALPAELLIELAEGFDIRNDDIVVAVGSGIHDPLGIAVEEGGIVDARNSVPLRDPQDGGRIGQADQGPDPVQNDVSIVGL